MALPVAKSLADQGYDGDSVRQSVLMRGILLIVSPNTNREKSLPAITAASSA